MENLFHKNNYLSKVKINKFSETILCELHFHLTEGQKLESKLKGNDIKLQLKKESEKFSNDVIKKITEVKFKANTILKSTDYIWSSDSSSKDLNLKQLALQAFLDNLKFEISLIKKDYESQISRILSFDKNIFLKEKRITKEDTEIDQEDEIEEVDYEEYDVYDDEEVDFEGNSLQTQKRSSVDNGNETWPPGKKCRNEEDLSIESLLKRPASTPILSKFSIESLTSKHSIPKLYQKSQRNRQIKTKSKQLPEEAIKIMKEWYDSHQANPYPSELERKDMSIKGSISVNQVKAWFANKRNRTNNTRPKNQTLKINSSFLLKNYTEKGLKQQQKQQDDEKVNIIVSPQTEINRNKQPILKNTKDILKDHLNSKECLIKKYLSSNHHQPTSFNINNYNIPSPNQTYFHPINNFGYLNSIKSNNQQFDYVNHQQQYLPNFYIQSLMQQPTTYLNGLNSLNASYLLAQQLIRKPASTTPPPPPPPPTTTTIITPPLTPISNNIQIPFYSQNNIFPQQQPQHQSFYSFYDNRLNETISDSQRTTNNHLAFEHYNHNHSQNLNFLINTQNNDFNKVSYDHPLHQQQQQHQPLSRLTPVNTNFNQLYQENKYLQNCLESSRQNKHFTNDKLEKWSINSHPKLASTLLDEISKNKSKLCSSLLVSKLN